MQRLATTISLLLVWMVQQSAPAAQKVVLVAGGGDQTDGSPAIKAALDSPFGVDFDRAGNLFLVEMTSQRVRKISRDGILSTVAGDGVKGNRGDGGPAAQAQFNGMHNLTIGPDDMKVTRSR